ncbi:FAD-dependent oxidoreductase [Calothrix sp. 336/3]|uniref:FAD-dependent oxidoreductase n=1 Tax=Calothrix sp. 336/3 TaxID=1337936 RepID=UPI00055777F0|nr:hypothetical protein [Calothrix sp. 336/3]AKG21808.1 hypothetical protein IJ00_11555 [Calothrix sp. 336/3]
MEKLGQQAIVIGSSIGGILAARVLTDYYSRVIILERDVFPSTATHRPGVIQGRHAHGLLSKGRDIIENLFPGIIQELTAMGGIPGDVVDSNLWFLNGGYLKNHPSQMIGILVSRLLLEFQLRQRLFALPNIQTIENCEVLGLITNSNKSRITGIRYINRSDDNSEIILNGDLIIDASGRRSQTPLWLEEIGYSKAPEERVNIGVSYTTRIYERKPEDLQGKLMIAITSCPPLWRGGVMIAQENDRWIVSIGGYLEDYAPTEEEKFLQFAKSLPSSDIYEVIKNARPLSEFLRYKYPYSQRHYYEKLERFPQGYLVFADAICSFNPIYGQGMTVAALEAITLQKCLENGTENLYHRFFKDTSKIVDCAWNIVMSNDMRIPQVEGKRSLAIRFINWYIAKLHIAAQEDSELALAFMKVVNMVNSPASIMHPRIFLKIIWGYIKSRKIANLQQDMRIIDSET